MTLSAAEQFLLELINRGRLDPLAEAARIGIDLNQGLAAGTINGAAKQVLAASSQLEMAAVLHSQWMLEADIFSHTGAGNSNPGDRIEAQGYSWSTYGENIAMVGSTGTMTAEGSVADLYRNLFLSAGHRTNTLKDSFSELGLGVEVGRFTSDGVTYNAALLTENFATRTSQHFLTGVAYADRNGDRFYSMGEGVEGVVFQVGAQSAASAAAGGYGLIAGNGKAVAVTGQAGAVEFGLTVDMRAGNVKLDLVDGATLMASGSVILGVGVDDLLLLGVGRINGTGNAFGNVIEGNRAGNILSGRGGADALLGGGGADRIAGGRGNDTVNGGAGADAFVFLAGDGVDRIGGFSAREGDSLRLDDGLWAGQTLGAQAVVAQFGRIEAGHVVLEFEGGETLHLMGVGSLSGLAVAVDIV